MYFPSSAPDSAECAPTHTHRRNNSTPTHWWWQHSQQQQHTITKQHQTWEQPPTPTLTYSRQLGGNQRRDQIVISWTHRNSKGVIPIYCTLTWSILSPFLNFCGCSMLIYPALKSENFTSLVKSVNNFYIKRTFHTRL